MHTFKKEPTIRPRAKTRPWRNVVSGKTDSLQTQKPINANLNLDSIVLNRAKSMQFPRVPENGCSQHSDINPGHLSVNFNLRVTKSGIENSHSEFPDENSRGFPWKTNYKLQIECASLFILPRPKKQQKRISPGVAVRIRYRSEHEFRSRRHV